jgi:exosortase A-associated hydrolase 1
MTSWSEEPLVFECAGAQLMAVLHHGSARTGVVVVVGGPQYRTGSHRQFVLMARQLAQQSVPVLRFDYRGMGDSDGEPRTFEAVADDIRAAIDAFMAQSPQLTGVVLWGLCDAATACTMYAATDERVRGLIVANPWVHTTAGAAKAYVKRYYAQRLLQRSFWTKVAKGEFKLGDSLADFARKLVRASLRTDAAQTSSQPFIERMRLGLQRFGGPVLVLMSEHDLTAQEFRDLCRSSAAWARLLARPASTVVDLAGADHTFSSHQALQLATVRCIQWLHEHERALGEGEPTMRAVGERS